MRKIAVLLTALLIHACSFCLWAQDQQPPADQSQQTVPALGDTTQAPSQQQPAEPDKDSSGTFVFRKQVSEVQLRAIVTDQQHQPVTNLDRNAFEVYENGVLRPIVSFRRDDIPVAMGIVIDNSGSMRNKRPIVNQAALELVNDITAKDQAFVVNFDLRPYLDQDFTGSADQLSAALSKTQTRGETALYDAISAAAHHLQHSDASERKVLLVITDGSDNVSSTSESDLVRQLQSDPNGPVIYAIGLLPEQQQRTRRLLQQIATASGGMVFFSEDLSQVEGFARTIARDIRRQYVIGFTPQQGTKGYRELRLVARGMQNQELLVRTRSGFNSQ